jgi:hypothetical protein
MQFSNAIKILGRLLGAAMLTVALAASAAAQSEHAGHRAGKEARTELGTSTAVDSRGHIWTAGKETTADGQFVVLQESADGGKTWSEPRRIQREPEAVSAEGENRPKIAFGRKGEIYVTYTKPLAKPYTGEIRFVRSIDGGKTFAAPVTVHANRDLITHRFESLIVDGEGRIYVAWIDKRDMEAAAARKQKYAGAALYYAVSEDSGASFKGDYKVADHSCECCRIALALNPQGRPVALWRHVFEPNARDHALAEFTPDGKIAAPVRATFDDWRVDACPHHGPALAYAPDGIRHQVWFNVKGDEGGIFYAAIDPAGVGGKIVRLGSAQAEHGDVAVRGKDVVLVWKQFDGKATAILGKLSKDGGKTWEERELARTQGVSDQPHLLTTPTGILLVWRTQNEGVRTLKMETNGA